MERRAVTENRGARHQNPPSRELHAQGRLLRPLGGSSQGRPPHRRQARPYHRKAMSEIIRQLLTGKDNATYDIGRVTWLVSLVAIIALAFYEVMHNTVSIRELAESLGIVSAAGGASVAMKAKSEPDQ